MNQSKKRIKLHMPGTAEQSSVGERMPIANVTEITPKNSLRREANQEEK